MNKASPEEEGGRGKRKELEEIRKKADGQRHAWMGTACLRTGTGS